MDIRITHVISLDASLMALLVSSVSGAALAASAPTTKPAPQADKPIPQGTATAGTEGADLEAKATATVNGDVDAHGHPWSADLHAATKGTTKDGLWRMKVGVSRPDPKPGFPKDAAATPPAGAENPNAVPANGAAAAATDTDEDDEFAAFRAAADKGNATDAAAAAAVPARKWTDADLGALCNQAAVKLGDPAPVKALIAEHVPEGTVPHSRNIPDDGREAFAKAVEAKAGIEFAG